MTLSTTYILLFTFLSFSDTNNLLCRLSKRLHLISRKTLKLHLGQHIFLQGKDNHKEYTYMLLTANLLPDILVYKLLKTIQLFQFLSHHTNGKNQQDCFNIFVISLTIVVQRILDKTYAMGIGQDMMNIVECSMPRILDAGLNNISIRALNTGWN